MRVPIPTPIYRITHIDNLSVILNRRAIHAPNFAPKDGFNYRAIHNMDIQRQRGLTTISCGPGGVLPDYVPFYFGPRSPMLFQLHTGYVTGYSEGQSPIIYLVTSAQTINNAGVRYIFSDGHGIAAYTKWFDDLRDLKHVDWTAAYDQIWRCTPDDPDHQRRKQAEFLVHEKCDWDLIHEIGVINASVKHNVDMILRKHDRILARRVMIQSGWYY